MTYRSRATVIANGGEGGQITLEGVSGELALLRVYAPDVREGHYDPFTKVEIEARFHMRAHRMWSMR